jgi:hypothetical protein
MTAVRRMLHMMKNREETMDKNGFEELFGQAGEVVRALRSVYSEVTGEELDLESALKNYPLIVIGVVAGAGFFGGWLIGRRNAAAALPPPPATQPSEPVSPLDLLGRVFPTQVNKVREVLPEGLADEAATAARHWVDGVLEPMLKDGLNSTSNSRFGAFVRETVRRSMQSEDRTLDDPETDEPGASA